MTTRTLLLLTGLGAGMTGLPEVDPTGSTSAPVAPTAVMWGAPPPEADPISPPQSRVLPDTGAQAGDVTPARPLCVVCWL